MKKLFIAFIALFTTLVMLLIGVASAQVGFYCNGVYSRIDIGHRVNLPNTGGNVYLRRGPEQDDSIIARLEHHEYAIVIGGPFCIDGFIRWQVALTNVDNEGRISRLYGYIAENDGFEYLLQPIYLSHEVLILTWGDYYQIEERWIHTQGYPVINVGYAAAYTYTFPKMFNEHFGTNIRSGPGLTFRATSSFSYLDGLVNIAGRNASGTWLKIWFERDGYIIEGWVSAYLLRTNVINISDLPVLDYSSNPAF